MRVSCSIQHLTLCAILQCLLLCNIESLCSKTSSRTASFSIFDRAFRSAHPLRASTDSAIENFEKSWAANNIIAKSVKHSTFDWVCGKLRGLQATTSQFKQGSPVLSVPITQTLSASDNGMQGCPAGLEELWKDLRGTSRVSLLLMMEWLLISKKNSAKSKFSTYIDALPAPGSLGTPFHWSEEYLDAFPYKPMVSSVKLQRLRWRELYSKVEKSKEFTGVSYERFVWAMEMVRSRAFTGLGGNGKADYRLLAAAGAASTACITAAVMLSKTAGVNEAIPIALGSVGALCLLPAVLSSSESSCVLLPAIDSSNHDGSNPLCNIALEPIQGCFQMIANRNINVAEQITISYGNRNNDDLLQYFGFVEVNCQFDRYVILDPVAVLQIEIEEIIQNNGDSKTWRSAVDILEKNSTPLKSMIIDRKDMSTWELSSLDAIKDSELKNRCVQVMILAEKKRMEKSLFEMSATNTLPSDLNSCVVRTFLAQKIDVLTAASKVF